VASHALYTLSLHDALPLSGCRRRKSRARAAARSGAPEAPIASMRSTLASCRKVPRGNRAPYASSSCNARFGAPLRSAARARSKARISSRRALFASALADGALERVGVARGAGRAGGAGGLGGTLSSALEGLGGGGATGCFGARAGTARSEGGGGGSSFESAAVSAIPEATIAAAA